MSREEESVFYEGQDEYHDFSQSTIAMQDPEMRAYYNVASNNQDLTNKLKWNDSTWLEDTASGFKKFSWMGALADTYDTQVARIGRLDSVDMELLIEGVPEQFHTDIYTELEQHGNLAAYNRRDQIRDSLANNAHFDNMEWYAQVGYGGLAMILDPVNIMGSVGIFKAADAVSKGFKGLQQASIMSAGINGGRAWLATGLVSNTAKVSGWAAIGAAEGALTNAPQLAADPTYTAADYMLDIAFDSALALGFVGTAKTFNWGKDAKTYQQQQDEAYRKLQQDIQRKVDPEEVIPTQGLTRWQKLGHKLGVVDPPTQPLMRQDSLSRLDLISGAGMKERWLNLGLKLGQGEDALKRLREIDKEIAEAEATTSGKAVANVNDHPELQAELAKVDADIAHEHTLGVVHKPTVEDLYKERGRILAKMLPQPDSRDVTTMLTRERAALIEEFNTLQAAGRVVEEPSTTDVELGVIPAQNQVPVDATAMRQRDIRHRIDAITEQLKDLVEEPKPRESVKYATLRDIARISKRGFDTVVNTVAN